MVSEKRDLANYDGEDCVVPIGDLSDYIAELNAKSCIIHCDLQEIDKELDGFNTGELVILSGGVKTGKSLLVKTLIDQFFKRGHTSIVFSYEEALNYFVQGFEGKTPMFFCPKKMKAYDIDWVIERTKEARIKYGTRLCFIDHGHWLFDMSMRQNASLHIGDIARKLKRLAVEEDIVVMLVWHIYKERIESPEDLDQILLRDSGMVAAECDTILMTYRKASSDGIVSTNESGIMICVTRRSGVWHRYICTEKKGKYLYEKDFMD